MSRSLPETYRTVQVGVKRGRRQIQWIVRQRRDGSALQHHKFYRHLMFSYCRSVCRNHLMGNYHKVYQSVLSFHVILQHKKSFPKVITPRVKVSSFCNSTKTSIQLCHSGMPTLSSPHMTNCRHFWIWSKRNFLVIYLFFWYSITHKYFCINF